MAYTNSPLVTYTNITNHKTSPRKKPIDTITIHCIVGQLTAKQGCDYFATTDRECSANYVVGKDGSIGLSVDEKDRSWCSSSSANDNRAITIEVASDTKAPYAVTDAAYNALIQLVADICKRNNIKKLVWSTEKDDRVNHKNGCNMTVHRDYANKSCPGEYLYERHGDIAAKVNAILAASVVSSDTGEMTDEEMFKFFKSHGMTDAGVAGLMGNLFAESGLKSTNLQNTFEKKLGMTDSTYTEAVDNGSYDNFIKDSAGYGLAQWTFWSRKQALLEFMKKHGVSIGHKKKQCEFLVQEIKGYKNTWKVLTSTSSVQEASDVVLTEYERPADQSDSVKAKRASFGQPYFDKYADKPKKEETKSDVLYCVQVGAFRVKTYADAQLKKVSEAGFDTYMVQVDGYYKIQVGAYSKKSNADAMLEKVQGAGFNAFIAVKNGQAVATVAPVVKKEIKVGSVVRLKKGAKTYTGGNLASFVYDRNHVVKQINVDRVVITYNNVVIAAVKKSDLTLVE